MDDQIVRIKNSNHMQLSENEKDQRLLSRSFYVWPSRYIKVCIGSKAQNLYGYIPLGIVSALRWQFNPAQVKSICNTNDSTSILYGFFNKMKNIWSSVL